MKEELLKYKHYLIMLSALLVANFITEPLWQLQQEQKQEMFLLAKHAAKANRLLEEESSFSEKLSYTKKVKENIKPFIFTQDSEAKFKLAAQEKLEGLLTKANCTMERVNWLSHTQVGHSVNRWNLELRFNGTPACQVRLTRALENSQPLMKIQDFSFSSEGITGAASSKIITRFTINVFHDASSFIQNLHAEGEINE